MRTPAWPRPEGAAPFVQARWSNCPARGYHDLDQVLESILQHYQENIDRVLLQLLFPENAQEIAPTIEPIKRRGGWLAHQVRACRVPTTANGIVPPSDALHRISDLPERSTAAIEVHRRRFQDGVQPPSRYTRRWPTVIRPDAQAADSSLRHP